VKDSTTFLRPEWVILGVVTPPEGVMLIASNQMSRAELEAHFENRGLADYLDRASGPFALRTPRYTATLWLDRFVMVHGTSYQDALHRLFGQWQPDTSPMAVLDPARKGIGRG
jgi:hypothetical protein